MLETASWRWWGGRRWNHRCLRQWTERLLHYSSLELEVCSLDTIKRMKNNKIISKNTKVRVTLGAEVMTLLLAANRGDFIVEIRSPKRESNVVKIRHVTARWQGVCVKERSFNPVELIFNIVEFLMTYTFEHTFLFYGLHALITHTLFFNIHFYGLQAPITHALYLIYIFMGWKPRSRTHCFIRHLL